VTAQGLHAVFDLRVSDCIATTDTALGDSQDVLLVPCDTLHQAEVFALLPYPNDTYPGAAAMATFADQSC